MLTLKERAKLPWNLKESGFWLRDRGIKLYEDIRELYLKRCGAEKAQQLLSKLELALDEWDAFISGILERFERTKKYRLWEKGILSRDKNECRECGVKEDLKIHLILSMSELLADYVLKKGASIEDVNIEQDCFYQKDNGVTLCLRCSANQDWFGNPEVLLNKICFKGYLEEPNKLKTSLRLRAILDEVRVRMRDDKLQSKEWFSCKLEEIRTLRRELGASPYSNVGGANRLFEIQILFRIGEYDLAKRLAIRQERFLRKEDEMREDEGIKKQKTQKNFAARNREKILIEAMDLLTERYKQGDYSIQYATPESYETDCLKNVFREAENHTRKVAGVPLIGEGWITETEVFHLVKDILSEYEVVHHARPKWLERQEFDIFIPELKLAIEYMGEQHYRPVGIFGGEEGFKRVQDMDSRKKIKAAANGVEILFVKFDDSLDRDILRERIISLLEKEA